VSAIVAVVGRPNVGKSTLFNRLIGYRKAIVDDQPGVTRDRNYARTEIDGQPVTVVDTGGFETGGDRIVDQVRRQTLAAVDEADLILFVLDGKAGLTPTDHELVDTLRRSGRPFVTAVNKVDGEEKEGLLDDFHALGLDEILPVSAAHGYGVRDLVGRLVELLPEPKQAAPPEDLVRVSIIGRPNVGKSTLVNALIGDERTVVSDQPGTTRDPVDIELSRGQQRYLLVDTAGIRRKGKVPAGVEKFAVMRALRSLERSDLALLLVDSREGLTDQDAHVAGYALERGRAPVILFNKWDLVEDRDRARRQIRRQLDLKAKFIGFAPHLIVSALTGQGVNKIFGVVDGVFRQYIFEAPTGQVNRVLSRAVEAHAPPYVGRGRLKFNYATQTNTRPPTFTVFTNRPDKVHFSYQRYLANAFRDAFGLSQCPVRVRFRSKRKERS
jgi:GTP-binding protein